MTPPATTTAAPFTTPHAVPRRYTFLPSPIGELTVVGDGASLTGLYLGPEHRWAPPIGPDWVHTGSDDGPFAETSRQLERYFDGRLREFALPLAPTGTPFQLRVWAALAALPYGATATYGELAASLGAPSASRAVGLANGRNPISIIVPCHRVIGANGNLTGYGGGLDRKRTLLDLEGHGPVQLW